MNLGQADEDWQSFLEATADLINTGIKSAIKTIQILSCEEGLLGELRNGREREKETLNSLQSSCLMIMCNHPR